MSRASVSLFLRFFAMGLGCLAVSRIGLMTWQADRFGEALYVQTLLAGLRVDIMTISMILAPPALLLLLSPGKFTHHTLSRKLIAGWLVIWFSLLVFMEAATPAYMDFFSARPGRIFFEYLGSPREVSGLIAGGYAWTAVIVVTLTVVSLLLARQFLGPAVSWKRPSLKDRLVLGIVFLFLVIGARSSLGHRPANPSTFALTGDQLVNDIALNSTYRVLYALYSLRHEDSPEQLYPAMEEAEVIAAVRSDMGTPAERFIDDISTRHRVEAREQPARPKSIVIIIEESLGARFVGALGGLPLTPRLDELLNKGIWFNRLYATGIRSARGLEAVLTGFPPSPSRSVLKLSGSQSGFYTIARSLKPLGYRSYFIYGGEAHFDNMQGFLLNNGFDEAIDQDDYEQWRYKGTWGVSDEDLFSKTHEVLSSATQPVLAVAFTSSFHSPYEFPDGKIELYEEPRASKHNAVKYADYALGQFLDRARGADYWDDTLILIVADHDERPRGYDLVPISSYHIPGVITGGGIEPRQVDRITSQIDLVPTLLQLAGIGGVIPCPGEDVLNPRDPGQPGRAVMQYGDNHAYMRGSQVVIHQPGLEPKQFSYDKQRDRLTPEPIEQDLARTALGWALLPGLLYQSHLYSN